MDTCATCDICVARFMAKGGTFRICLSETMTSPGVCVCVCVCVCVRVHVFVFVCVCEHTATPHCNTPQRTVTHNITSTYQHRARGE